MALAEVGRQIAGAFEKMAEEDEEKCLDEISRALLQAHVPADLVHKFSVHVKMDRNLMQQALFYELCALLGQGELVYTPEKGRQCIVMFIGLQDSGKTTTCTKYALYYQKKGWRPSLICADTSRPGAYEQLKQNAVKANIPFFGSYSELDPVTITKQGIEKFKKENSDLIIVDTSGHHKQEASLFKEIHRVSEMMSPDLIVSVIDGNIGQAAFDEVQFFKQNVPVGAVIVTKMDGHSKGVGTLSSVAAANSPVIFFGTGEHMDDFEQFKVKTFVSRLLGQQDGSRFLNKMRLVPMDEQPKRHQDSVEQTITLRRLYNEYQSKSRIGPLDQLFPTITGVMQDHDNEKDVRMKKFIMIMESMSDAELDEPNPKMLLKQSRVNKIARRSGHTTNDVHELLAEFKRWMKLARVWKVSKKASQYMNEAISPRLLKTDKLLWRGLKDVGPSSALHLHRNWPHAVG